MRKEIIGDATLYLGDCMEVMADIPDKSVDAVVTDPPYGIDYGGQIKNWGDGYGGANKNGWKSWGGPEWDKERPSKKTFDEMRRISRIQVIWGGNYFTDYLPPTMQWLVWDKGQRGFTLADCEIAWSSRRSASRVITYARATAMNAEKRQHPTQKPLAVMLWSIEKAKAEQPIFDPFMGSGTTGVACMELGRKFIGVEIEEKYFDIACKRIDAAERQGKLFV